MIQHKSNNSAGWISVYSSNDPLQVEIRKSLLAEHGVNAVILDQHDSFYKIGEVLLYVHEQDMAKAQFILNNNLL